MSSWNDVTKRYVKYGKILLSAVRFPSVAVLASALLQSYVILAFIRPAGLLSSGFTGLTILIDRITELYGFTVSTSLALVVLNLPVALMCCRSINVEIHGVFAAAGIFASFFLKVCHYTPLFDDLTLNVIFGGVPLLDCPLSLSLKGNASTGGTDFIALYVSNKTGKSILELCVHGKCVYPCNFWTHVRLGVCRIFHPVPVHLHKDDLHLPSPL